MDSIIKAQPSLPYVYNRNLNNSKQNIFLDLISITNQTNWVK